MTSIQLERARSSFERGRFKEARGAYKQALKFSPSDPDVLSELGAVEAELENYSAARKLMQKAIKIAPRDAYFLFNLAELERKSKRHAEAEKLYRTILDLNPADTDALFGLGLSIFFQNRSADSITVFQDAHSRSPRDPEILNALGNAMVANGQNTEAVKAFHKAIELDQTLADAWFNLGVCLFELESFEQADQAFSQASTLKPIEDRLLWKWAQTQLRVEQFEKAFENANATIAARPDIPQAYFIRGVAYEYFGKFDEAERDFRKVIKLRADVSEAYEKLAQMKRLDLDCTDVLENVLADDEGYVDTSRASAGFTLYRVYDRAGDQENAFRALRKANDIKAKKSPFLPELHAASVDHLMEIFTPEFFERHAGEGHDTESPIFVFGMPRSGTTLTEQILAGVPGVFPGGEQLAIQDFTKSLPEYPDCLTDVPSDWARTQATQILETLRSKAAGNEYVTDKTPGNYLCIGLIAWLFPKAKLVHCRRDLRDVGYSCYEQNFSDGLRFVYSLDGIALTSHYYIKIMEHWRKVVPIRIYDAVYEDLVSNPQGEGKNLVEFCGFEWDDSYLDTAKVDRPVQTASVWQVRQPINKAAVGKWRRYEEYLSPLLEQLEMP